MAEANEVYILQLIHQFDPSLPRMLVVYSSQASVVTNASMGALPLRKTFSDRCLATPRDLYTLTQSNPL